MTQKTHSNGNGHTRAKEEILDAGEAVKEAVSDYAERAMDELGKVPQLIKKYPVQSVLIGLGIGLLGGIFLRKQMEK